MLNIKMPQPKVTYIEDLPELDDFFDSKQQSMQGFPPRVHPDFSKQMGDEMVEREKTMRPLQGRIRQSNDFRNAVNGGGGGGGMGGMMSDMMSQLRPPPPPPRPDYLLIEPSDYKLGPRAQPQPPQPSPEYIQRDTINMHMQSRELTCIEIAKHIKDCPICSKFYDTDKSLYIIIIIILVIFCILLLKKCLFLKD